jgi:hypothetical protein
MAATSAELFSTPEKMKNVPTISPEIEPGGLNAAAKFSRRSLVAGSPNSAIRGFAAVSRIDDPDPTTNSAMRNGVYCPITAAGQNSSVPVAKTHSPVIRPTL